MKMRIMTKGPTSSKRRFRKFTSIAFSSLIEDHQVIEVLTLEA